MSDDINKNESEESNRESTDESSDTSDNPPSPPSLISEPTQEGASEPEPEGQGFTEAPKSEGAPEADDSTEDATAASESQSVAQSDGQQPPASNLEKLGDLHTPVSRKANIIGKDPTAAQQHSSPEKIDYGTRTDPAETLEAKVTIGDGEGELPPQSSKVVDALAKLNNNFTSLAERATLLSDPEIQEAYTRPTTVDYGTLDKPESTSSAEVRVGE